MNKLRVRVDRMRGERQGKERMGGRREGGREPITFPPLFPLYFMSSTEAFFFFFLLSRIPFRVNKTLGKIVNVGVQSS